MPVNPEILALLGGGNRGPKLERYPFAQFDNIGDGPIGAILEVGDPFDMRNKNFGKVDPKTGQENTKEFIKTWVWNLETADGKRTLWLNKPGQFIAVIDALETAKLEVPPIGWTFGMKWVGIDKKNNGMYTFTAKFVKPGE